MIEISNNNIITVNRGDSFKSILFLNEGTDLTPVQYVLKENEEVYLGIMEPNQPFENAILKKKFTNENLNKDNNIVIKIDHNDTKCLLPGKYFYEIKVKLLDLDNNFEINTVIQRTEFIIEE